MPAPETLRHLGRLYDAADDPWDHATSAYERDKHAATVAAAGPGPHRDALEIGCGNGVLSERLAPLCLRLTAVDCISAAAALARARLRRFPHVRVVEGDARPLPVAAPDLVVLSEVLYFLQPEEIAALAQALRAAPSACRIVAVNWLGATDEALDGQMAADLFARHLPLWTCRRHRNEGYLLDVFDHPGRARHGTTDAPG